MHEAGEGAEERAAAPGTNLFFDAQSFLSLGGGVDLALELHRLARVRGPGGVGQCPLSGLEALGGADGEPAGNSGFVFRAP